MLRNVPIKIYSRSWYKPSLLLLTGGGGVDTSIVTPRLARGAFKYNSNTGLNTSERNLQTSWIPLLLCNNLDHIFWRPRQPVGLWLRCLVRMVFSNKSCSQTLQKMIYIHRDSMQIFCNRYRKWLDDEVQYNIHFFPLQSMRWDSWIREVIGKNENVNCVSRNG